MTNSTLILLAVIWCVGFQNGNLGAGRPNKVIT